MRAMPAVVGDLKNGLKLTKFVWHKTIDEAGGHDTPPQVLVFNIVTQPALKFMIDGQSYDPDRIDREMTVGSAQEWRLSSLNASHPFHIHVNPFQVVSIVNAAGDDVTDPTKLAYDPDHAGVIGQWKDTLFVKQGDHLVVRTWYERYIGDYVLHCHHPRPRGSGHDAERAHLPSPTVRAGFRACICVDPECDGPAGISSPPRWAVVLCRDCSGSVRPERARAYSRSSARIAISNMKEPGSSSSS